MGAASVASLVALRRFAPAVPGTLVVLVLGVIAAALLDLADRGVDVVGDLPRALPDPALPDVGWADAADLLPAALGVVVLSTEAVGVARALASRHGYDVDSSRELVAIGGSNLLAGLSSGFIQSGGASQTAAAESAGGRTPLTSLAAAVLIVLTGAFLAPLFEDLPLATLAAIVIVAVAGFLRVDELRRFARVRTSALVFGLIALVGVLLLGVLQGLLVAAALSLGMVVQRLSRPTVARLARDPVTGLWGNAERNPEWEAPAGVLVVGSEGPLFYVERHRAQGSGARARARRPGATARRRARAGRERRARRRDARRARRAGGRAGARGDRAAARGGAPAGAAPARARRPRRPRRGHDRGRGQPLTLRACQP